MIVLFCFRRVMVAKLHIIAEKRPRNEYKKSGGFSQTRPIVNRHDTACQQMSLRLERPVGRLTGFRPPGRRAVPRPPL
ncbi:hypothetical protein HMPREF9135_1038 [Segatella baroniae F0067]|uniref:Uncharacterized protein n=1 Tax=Segatella baroniae F0067 TaxID=1115809 RepID=U2Q9X3_9BACT|nr:hypothetical protein HMPREF9135_1038 [Segatella baroniae F0067]